MHTLQLFLEQSPVLALFLVIALGYGLGAVRVAGVSFGVGAVLFIGLAIGAMAPKSVPPALEAGLYGTGHRRKTASRRVSYHRPTGRPDAGRNQP